MQDAQPPATETDETLLDLIFRLLASQQETT